MNTVKCKKGGYSQIRNEALAYAFSYMNLIEHWGSGIPRIIEKVKAAGLREPEFIGGEVDLRVNIYRGQVESAGKVPESDLNDLKNDPNDPKNAPKRNANDLKTKMIALIHKKPELTYAELSVKREQWESYEDMNRVIISQIENSAN